MFEELFEKCLVEGQSQPFWMDPNGKLIPVTYTHYADSVEILKKAGVSVPKDTYWEDLISMVGKETGYVRIVIEPDELGVDLLTPTITGKQRMAILSLAREYPHIFWSTVKRGEYGSDIKSFVKILNAMRLVNV